MKSYNYRAGSKNFFYTGQYMMVKGHKLQIRLISQVNLNELRITSSTSMTPLDISLGKYHWSVAVTSESQMGCFPFVKCELYYWMDNGGESLWGADSSTTL